MTLPTVSKSGYDLVGWQDAAGNVYTDTYTMPIGDITLTAKWALTTAYAVYCADDTSLTFYNTSETITAGSTYNGKTVTAVYTGFLDKNYTFYSKPPWGEDYELDITKVIVADKISPTKTGGWFLRLRNCTYMDLAKLDTGMVTDMNIMFSLAGNYVTTFEIIGVSDWNVSNVTDMSSMFNGMAKNATWTLDLTGWDVSNVTKHNNFDVNCESKVIDPIWVN